MRACRDQSDQTGTVPGEGKKHASPQSSRRLGSRAPAIWKAVEATLMARQSIPEVTATLNYAYTFKMQTAHLWETVPCFQDPFPSKRCPVGQGLGSSFPPQKKKKITSPQKCVPAPPGPGRTQRKPPRAFPPLLFSSECVQMEPAWRKNKLGFQTHRKQFQACASIFFNLWKNSPYSGLLSVRNLLGLHQFSKYLWPPNIRHARGLP